jgi:DNA invertase Pin-like site-specific DNA recombinase
MSTIAKLTAPVPRAALYLRISQDRDNDQLGVARQEHACRELADRLGVEVAEVFKDNDVSAYSGKKRPCYLALLDAIRHGEIDMVLCWHPDRLTVTPRELEDLIDLLAKKVTVHTVNAGFYDLSTPTGQMMARMAGTAGRYEREQKAERQKAKNEQLVRDGWWGGGPVIYGYRATKVLDGGKTMTSLVVHEPEAKWVRWMADAVLAGESLLGIERHLNAQGVPAPRAAHWSRYRVRKVLLSPTIAGWTTLNGEPAAEAKWEAIIPKSRWDDVREVLADPARNYTKRARSFLLASLCFDPGGNKMRTRTSYVRGGALGPRIYTNDSAGGVIHADYLEEFVVEAMLRRFDTVAATTPALDAEPDADQAEVDALEAELAELATARGRGQIKTLKEYLLIKAATEERLAAAQARTRSSRRQARRQDQTTAKLLAKPGALRKAWEAKRPDGTPVLSFDEQRRVVKDRIERIVIRPTEPYARVGFDPKRVKIKWA